MKDIRVYAVVAGLAGVCGFAGSAFAADWGGFYQGISAGYGWGKADVSADIEPSTSVVTLNSAPNLKPKGWLLGAQAGYNWQDGKIVYGVEGDMTLTGMSDKERKDPALAFPPIPGKMTAKQDVDWIATVRGRLGYAVEEKWLVYGTGGLAIAHLHNKTDVFFPPRNNADSGAKLGWVAGAGAEWQASAKMSVKIEYLHYDVGQSSDNGDVGLILPVSVKTRWDTKGNLMRVGLNFHF